MKHATIAFLSDFTIRNLAEEMEALCKVRGIHAKTYVAPYGQFAQEILIPSSKVYTFDPDIIFILIGGEGIFGDFYASSLEEERDDLSGAHASKTREMSELLVALKGKVKSKIVMCSIPTPVSTSLGILEGKSRQGIRNAVKEFNRSLEDLSRQDSQMWVFDMDAFFARYGKDALVDQKMYYLADMRFSLEGIAKLAKEFMAYLVPLTSLTKKCIVLDLDNTLWGGVIGEDGIERIKLGPEKEGKPYMDFQKRLLALHERGILLTINSKNNLDDALEAIRNHEYMVLREEHFSCMRINWQDKVSNMREIANELNIGLDSFVFFDDDGANIALVEERLPEVMCVQMPKDYARYPEAIESLDVFNAFSITTDDRQRGKMYAQEKKRHELKSSFQDIDSFIKGLSIKISIIPATPSTIPRITQLTQKTNQFNLTTKRYQEEDIKRFSESKEYVVRCIQVEDRFGDYGITGVCIIRNTGKEGVSELDTYLMSCRILGKKIEQVFLESVMEELSKAGIKKLDARFVQTKKNDPAREFLPEFGFELIERSDSESSYMLDLKKVPKKEKLMEVVWWKP